jgi:hypothetical protein
MFVSALRDLRDRNSPHPTHICGRYRPVLLTSTPATIAAGASAATPRPSTAEWSAEAPWQAWKYTGRKSRF